jgi:error-prone DNA polymerase
LAQEANPIEQPLLQQITDVENTPETLQPMSLQEEVLADYQTKGLSLRAHPISFIRNELTAEKCSKIEELATMRSGRHARVAGIVLVRQRPSTAKGITFVTIEDETGQSNLIFYAAVWKRFLRVAQTSHAWIIDGKVENSNGIVHVVVGRLSDLSEKIEMSNLNPRNFH